MIQRARLYASDMKGSIWVSKRAERLRSLIPGWVASAEMDVWLTVVSYFVTARLRLAFSESPSITRNTSSQRNLFPETTNLALANRGNISNGRPVVISGANEHERWKG